MKKILFIVSTLSKCGPTSQLFNIVKYLDKDSFDATVLTLSPEPEVSLYELFIEQGIKVTSLNYNRLKGMFLSQSRVAEFIKSHQFDLIHTQGYRADLLISKLGLSKPIVCTIRNFPQIDFPMEYGNLLGHLMAKKHFQAMVRFNAVVGVSEPVIENIQKHSKAEKIKVIENGVDTERFHSLSKENKGALRKSLKIKDTEIVFISSGGLIARKDPITLAKAFLKLEHHLVLIGEGELKSDLELLTENNDNIHVLGSVKDVNKWLGCADYYISASTAEGLPNAVIEAMACGLPAVLSDIGPHKEVAKYNPLSSSLFSLGEDGAIESAIADILSRDLATASAASYDIAEKSLNAKIMSRKYQGLYTSLS